MSLKQKLLIYILAIFVVVVIVGGFIITPTVIKILSLRNDINNIEGEMESRYKKIQSLKLSVQKLPIIKSETNKFSEITIKPGEELNVITELEKIAIENNIEQNTDLVFVDTKKDKPTNATTKKDNTEKPLPQYYKFSFLNNGYFADHIKYLQALEKLPYYMVIDKLSFEKKNNDEKQPNKITLRFDAIIYVDNK